MVFEGAQGVLLDQNVGFHPHTTWSNTTFDNALEMLNSEGYTGEITKLGILRTYHTRHGQGPFPTEGSIPFVAEPHNTPQGWQGNFRVGAFDAVLGRYAIRVCGGVDGLVITHGDRVSSDWKFCSSYEVNSNTILNIPVYPRGRQCDFQDQNTRLLSDVKPLYETPNLSAKHIPYFIGSILGAGVVGVGNGPTSGDMQWTI